MKYTFKVQDSISYVFITKPHIWKKCYDIIKKNFINIWFAIERLNKYILYARWLSKGMQATQSVKWNEMYKWKDDMKYPGCNLSWYMPKAYVHHTIGSQGIGYFSTIDQLATSSRAHIESIGIVWWLSCLRCWYQFLGHLWCDPH